MPPENSPYSYYLNLLGKWPTSIALASQWFLFFDFSSVNVLTGNLQGIINSREANSNWNYDENARAYLLDGSVQASIGNMMGCAFARQVTLPSETINASNQGLEYGGFQAPATSSGREKYEKFSVTMLETNASFMDLVLRPWAIATGYNGLVARAKSSPNYVKANFCDVVMLAKTAPNIQMGIRKVYRFFNVAPTKIPTEEYSYMEEGLRTGSVDFVYDNYCVWDGDTGSLVSLS